MDFSQLTFFKLTTMELTALQLSLKVSLWSVLVSLPLGILVSFVLSRKQFVGKSLIDGIIHLPLVLPPVVIGYLLLVLFGQNGTIGIFLEKYFGLSFAFRWTGAVLAAAIMSFPLLVRAIRLSLDAVDQSLEQAARTLGAGAIRVFFTITLPLAIPGIITGTVLAFARSLGEFGATIMFVSNIEGETQTLPLALYTMTQVRNGEESAMRLCLIAIVLAMIALLSAEFLSRRFARHINT